MNCDCVYVCMYVCWYILYTNNASRCICLVEGDITSVRIRQINRMPTARDKKWERERYGEVLKLRCTVSLFAGVHRMQTAVAQSV